MEDFLVSAATTTEWEIIEVTSGTPAGTSITAQNINLVSGVVADETAFGNAAVTGSLSGNTLYRVQTSANDVAEIRAQGLILGKNSIIAITAHFLDGGTATTTVSVIGHYETE